jgi:hypothetical protein
LKIGGKERIWVEQRGAGGVGNVRGALATINRNEEFINMAIAVLWTSHSVGLEFGRLAERITLLQLVNFEKVVSTTFSRFLPEVHQSRTSASFH